jgi:DNA polymerase
VIWFDCETFSEVPIKWGTYRYAENCEVMIVTYAFDDGPVRTWDVTAGGKMPGDLEYALLDTDDLVTAHNAMFDRTVLNLSKNLRVPISLERWRCNMVRALAHSLPGGLDKLCEILNVEQDKAKLKTGRNLIHLFCKPQPKNAKIRRATRETHPEKWQEFLDYAGMDIVAMREVARKMPKWNSEGFELDLWHLDQRINDRGFCVDVDLAQAAVHAVARAQKVLAGRTADITDGAVASTTQRDQLLAHILQEYGVELPDLQGATLERRIQDPDLPIELRELLSIRMEASTTSPAKYNALIRSVSSDGRLRGTLQFNGASRTCRWAGRVFQPQNLPRPDVGAIAERAGLEVKTSKYLKLKSAPGVKEEHIREFTDFGIEALKSDCADAFYPNVMALAATAIRGCIVAAPGKKLIPSDLANIEGRMAAWLAGEDWKLQAFRDYDAGTGPDLYKLAYAKSFRIDPADVDKQQRQIGKVQELMLQYEGGVGAFLTGSLTYGIDLEEMAEIAWPTLPANIVDEASSFLQWTRKEKRGTFGLSDKAFITCDALKRLWRAAHPAITSFWPEIKAAVTQAINNPGNTIQCRRVKVRVDGAWLRIGLPSGHALCYPNPRVTEGGQISYMGNNQYTKQWSRIKTYGGKFFEQMCQCEAGMVLKANLPHAEAAGYEGVLTVHDELLAEAPDTDDYSADGLSAILARVPVWAAGLPLAAAGFETYRYRKE